MDTLPNVLARYARALTFAGVALYLVSLAMLVLASTNDISQFPMWVGPLDVAVALLLVIAFVLLKIALGGQNSAPATQSSYTIFTYLIPITIAVIWFFREQLILNTLLPGLAWRTYVLFEMLPGAWTVLFTRRDPMA